MSDEFGAESDGEEVETNGAAGSSEEDEDEDEEVLTGPQAVHPRVHPPTSTAPRKIVAGQFKASVAARGQEVAPRPPSIHPRTPNADGKLADVCTASFSHKRKKGTKRPRNENGSSNIRTKGPVPHKRQTPVRDQTTTSSRETPVPIGPQVTFVNGTITVAEDSLVLQRPEDENEDECEVVEEDGTFNSTYTSYTKNKKLRSTQWGVEETRRFYETLRKTGLNFTLMKKYFPARHIRSLKNKYKREDKANPELVRWALHPSNSLSITDIVDVMGEALQSSELWSEVDATTLPSPSLPPPPPLTGPFDTTQDSEDQLFEV